MDEEQALEAYRGLRAEGASHDQAVRIVQSMQEPQPSAGMPSISEEAARLRGETGVREGYQGHPRGRGLDLVSSALVGAGMGIPAGPVGMAVGAVGGVAGTAVDHALQDKGLPWFLRLPASMAAGGGISSVGGRLTNRAMGALRPGAQQYLDDTARFGVTRRAGDIEDVAGAARRAEDALVSTGEPNMLRETAQQADEMQAAVRGFADEIAPELALEGAPVPGRVVVDELIENYDRARKVANAMYGRAAELAGDTPLGYSNAMSSADRVLFETAATRSSNDVAQLAGAIKNMPADEVTYDILRIWEQQANALSNLHDTGAAAGQAKILAGAIRDDLADWATSNPDAGAAHLRAHEFWRGRVLPFMRDRSVWRAVDQDSFEADRIITNVVGATGEGKPEATANLMDLLTERGRRAVGFDAMQRAADKGGSYLSSEFSPPQVFRGMNLGTAARPRTGRLAMRAAGSEEGAEALARLLRSTQRSTGGLQPSRTGKFLHPTVARMMGAGTGAVVGGTAGAGPVGILAGMALGAGAEKLGRSGASALLRSQPMIQYMMAQPGLARSGLLGTGAGYSYDIENELRRRGYTFSGLLGGN